jgi:purine nucleosidase
VTPRRRVVVDTDTGIDDAMALVWLATHPGVDLVAVGSTHGNCRVDQAAVNALRVLEACGRGDVPVAVGEAVPVAGDATFATHVHGADGLGDAGLPPPVGHPTGEPATDQIVRLGREQPGELDLLALGPLTNLAAALERDADALARFRSVTVMGGAGTDRAPGAPDPTDGVGDPNTAHDPLATARVAAVRPMAMVGVDVTLGVRLSAPDLARIARAATPHGRLVAAALPHYVRFHEARFGPQTCCAHDVVAAAVLTHPAVVSQWARGEVVVVEDATGGRAVLVPDARAASCAVVSLDGRAVVEGLLAALERPRT